MPRKKLEQEVVEPVQQENETSPYIAHLEYLRDEMVKNGFDTVGKLERAIETLKQHANNS